MTGFWIAAVALLAAVLVALLRPLMKPARTLTDDTAASNLRVLRAQLTELDAEHAAGRLDAEQQTAARAELERRVLDEGAAAAPRGPAQAGRGTTVALALAVPALALALYLHLGNRVAMDPAAQQEQEHAMQRDMATAVASLAEKLKAQPENADGWALLARSYASMEQFEPARDAYAMAVKYGRQGDPQLLADYADALAMTQGRRITGEAEALIARALAIDPNHIKALALAGSAAMARGDFAAAVKLWTRAREHAPPDSELAQGLAAGIAEARAAGGLPAHTAAMPNAAATPAAPGQGPRPSPSPSPSPGPGPGPGPTAAAAAAPAAGTGPASAAASGATLRVTVALAPALAAKVQPGDTLFVFARAAEGPRMPLAIARLPGTQLPAQVQLDDSMAMTPQMRLSAFANVVVVARISKKGAAAPEPGDLEGESAPRAPAGSVTVTIDRERP